MRLRRFALSALLPLAAGALLLSACDGDDDPGPTSTASAGGTSTPAPTATPFARVPDPVIVTGDGAPTGGGGSSEDAVTYVVESGDTLGGIADNFGVDIEVIQQANDLDGVDIFIGQELVIPRGGSTPGGNEGDSGDDEPAATSTPPSGVDTYTVEEGDTAFGIALMFDTSVEDLEEANDVGPGGLDDLQIGQVIRLPRPE